VRSIAATIGTTGSGGTSDTASLACDRLSLPLLGSSTQEVSDNNERNKEKGKQKITICAKVSINEQKWMLLDVNLSARPAWEDPWDPSHDQPFAGPQNRPFFVSSRARAFSIFRKLPQNQCRGQLMAGNDFHTHFHTLGRYVLCVERSSCLPRSAVPG
jgi:hypothetical protein